jgi:hypothetical protein
MHAAPLAGVLESPMRTLLLPFFSLALVACSGGFDGEGGKPDGSSGGGDDTEDDGGDGDDGGEDGGDGGDDGGDDGGVGDADVDDDEDGYTENEGDCDDNNSDVHPDAVEYCNNRDDDCDGSIDDPEDLADGQGDTRYEDLDGDGYGNPDVSASACEHSEGWVDDNTDCDDGAATAYPGGIEQNWNGIDENCDGEDFDLEGCMARAVENTADTMSLGSPWAMADYRGEYDLDVTFPFIGLYTFTGAGFGEVNDQLGFITELSSGVYEETSEDTYAVAFETEIGYNDEDNPFELIVGISESYWTAGFGGITVGDLITPVITAVTTLPDDFDGTVTCSGYVPTVPSDFDGTLTLNINEGAASVTADVDLASNIEEFGAGDAVLEGPEGGICGNEIIDVIATYIGIGDTWVFLNENLDVVGAELVAEYETTLEAEIAAECSG